MAATTPLNPNENSVAFDSGYLKVGTIHSLYYEQHGNKNGKPAVYLHGGPGGRATVTSSLMYFDLSVWRVVLFDQRGAGKSLPFAELRENTSQLLVEDIEVLRQHLSISKWHTVFGGSWGTTLGLLYAQTYPEAMSSLIMRGIFLVTDEELSWFYSSGQQSHGLETIFPDVKARWLQHLVDAGEDVSDPISAYYRLLTSEDQNVLKAAAREWSRQELETVHMRVDQEKLDAELVDEDFLIPFARVEVSYFKNRAWLRDNQLLEPEGIAKMKHLPVSIVHGRFDVVCPAKYAWKMYQALGGGREGSKCELHYTIAGHDREEPETRQKLIDFCKKYGEMELA